MVLALLCVGIAAPAFAQRAQYQFSHRNLKKMAKVFGLLQGEGTEEEQAANKEEAKDILLGINLKRAKPVRARAHPLYAGGLEVQDGQQRRRPRLPRAVCRGRGAAAGRPAAQPVHGRPAPDDARQLRRGDRHARELDCPGRDAFALVVLHARRDVLPGGARRALAPAKKAVELSVDTPRESWYRLLLSLYLERSDYDEALVLLDDIILAYPKKAYWAQMAAIYSEKDNSAKSLAVQQLAKREGFVTESKDKMRVAQMLMVEGLPHQGAAVMKAGLEDGSIEPTQAAYQTYSDTLLQSREWALAVEPLGEGGGDEGRRRALRPSRAGEPPARTLGRRPWRAGQRLRQGRPERRRAGPHPLRHRRVQRQEVELRRPAPSHAPSASTVRRRPPASGRPTSIARRLVWA